MAFNTIRNITNEFISSLGDIYPHEEIRNFVFIIFNFKMGYSKIDMLMKDSEELPQETSQFCKQSLERLKKQEPIQYILGETEFYGLPFNVNSHVLIPRPETEELVQWIIQDNKSPEPEILDIGTGSGCIPISLNKNITKSNISAWDISESALGVAKKNALRNNADINFIKQDALNPRFEENKYDIIVSNPPYIRELEKELMQNNVLDNEPHLALFVSNEDPLLFYRSISLFAIKALKPNGSLYFEINEAYGKETAEMMKSLGFSDVEIRKDLFGKDRMVKGLKDK